jgi:diguanylate cyclase (GGDEF)-like protein
LRASILVVDDDVTNIMMLAQLLQTEYEVIFATGGEQALELAASALPDLILLDVIMPGLDGYAVCAHLKADPLTTHIPVIFLTGLEEDDTESRCLEIGAVDYVTKPFNAAVVRSRVRNHVELKQMRDALLTLAATDGLTGIANRRRFDEVLETECKRLSRMRSTLALIMIDVDHFKLYNDTYGHVAGDNCLRAVADVLRASIGRAPDLAARYGGEEFACILPETALAGGVAIAERIQAGIALLNIEHRSSATAPLVTLSFGVVGVQAVPALVPTEIVSAADRCLYEAKASGRNRIVSASPVL